MAGLHFDITGDNSNFIRKLHECENGVRNTSKQIEQSGLGIEDLFNRMTKAAAAFGAGFTAKELITNIARVRGEFQQLEVAFKTMLGSEDKANALMQQLVKTAATTPFDLQGVANGAKQLLAYGENVENINDDLIRLGNIAAGLSQPLGDIVYLYGTTMTQGRLYTQDLNQFTGRGIPMIRELAKQFGVAENEVKSLVEAGKVGFPEVQKVIMSLTNEGGMFYNLMQEQSKTITGQISNIEDAISAMFNEIGKANEGIINDALSGVSYLVENYEKVGQILLEIVGTYGVYRTALMATSALQAIQASGITALTAKEAVHYGWLVLTKKAQDALNLSMLKNPYVLAAAAITGLVYGAYKLATAESEIERAIRETNDSLESQKNHYDELKNKAGELSNILSNESKSIEERFIAYRQLQRLMPEIFQNMDWETAKRKTNAELIRLEADELLRQQRIGLKTKVVMSQQKIQGLENSIIRTTNRGGYTGALKEDLDAAKKELEIYTKALEDFEKADEQAKKESEKPVVYNKKYWEERKKEAEDARAALDSSKENSEEWNRYTKQIQEAQAQIDKYSDPKTNKSLSNSQKEADKRKKEQERLNEELLAIRRQNQQAEIDLMKEGTERKLKQIDLDYQKEIDAIKKQKASWESSQSGRLTDEQTNQLGIWASNAARNREKGITSTNNERLEADKKAWQEYFIQFGNYQEKRKNLIQKYDDEIAKLEEHSAERATKIAEKNQAIDQLDEQFGKSTHVMADLFEDASEKSVSSIQDIIDKYELLIKYMSGTDESVSLINLKSVGFTDKDIANLENGTINIKDITDAIKRLKEEVKGKSPWLSFFSDMKKGIDDIKNANGDTRKLGQGISTIGGAITEFSPAIKQFGSDISSIFGEDLNDEINNVIDGLSGLGQTAVGVGQIMSGDIAGGIMSAVSGVSQLVNAMGNLFGPDGTAYYEGVKEQLEAINKVYDRIIDKSKEDIVFGGGFASVQAATRAMDNYEKKVINLQKIAAASGRAGASWKSHSAEWHSNKNVGAIGGFEQMSDILGKSISSMTDLYSLSGDELFLIQSQMPEAWSLIDARIRENLDSIVACKDEANELRDALNQAMTGVDFDSFYNGFIDQLSDMDTSFEDMCDNFEGYLRKSIMAGLVASQYQDRINALYEQWSDAAQSDKKITEEEANALKNQYQQIVNDMMRDREEMAKSFGWDASVTSQESSKKVSASVTQDSIDEVSGRFTALQIAGEEIKNQMISAVVGINSLIGISSSGNEILNNILNQHVITNNYLDDIAKYTKLLNDIKTDISEVRANTKGLSTR
ncbi:tape measure domain protein [Bacteroides caccae ATCC 43185]|jgi:tape measure domain-containing protein|uniref:tape measure protein n=2 Tax=Bacteroides caccae TaxID=47678 RepID=UPI000154645C|nr:tape measure protein [Bacteroides caccae]DAK96375.1 MAG TPA: tail tape measure protein [Caudoviricetes sp.]ASM66425.1 tape measure domain-containing protein [Bacteroides caccae]EDM22742.1 tape measure domain protein [Bacteroides caccae ATCC 43185]MDC7280968.1 tape measure protein [Bacteroides caccae]PQL34872.1 tape measure domain-containing protein [Bacteroides caccae]